MNLIQISPAPLAAGTWYQMSHTASRDARLSLEARGLLAYMLSRGTGWQMTDAERRSLGLGRDKARRLLAQLEAAGYLVRDYVRDPITRRFTASTWQVRQVPVIPSDAVEGNQPPTENPCADEPPTENPSTDIQSPETRRESVESCSKSLSVESSVVKDKESSGINTRETTDDDDLFSFLQQFGKFTETQKMLFEEQRQRLGDAVTNRVVQRVLNRPAVTRTIPYLLASLVNEPATPPPHSAPPPAPESDFPAWRLPTPHPDAVESDTVCEESDPITEPEMTTQRERDRWNLVMTQIKHQWDRVTFEAWLGRAVLKRVDADGRYVVQVGSEQAAQMLSTRLYRNVRSVLAGVTDDPDIEITFEAAPPPKPPKWLYPETPVYAGGAS